MDIFPSSYLFDIEKCANMYIVIARKPQTILYSDGDSGACPKSGVDENPALRILREKVIRHRRRQTYTISFLMYFTQHKLIAFSF